MADVSKKRKWLESLTDNHDGRPSVGNDELLGRLMIEHGTSKERGKVEDGTAIKSLGREIPNV